MTEWLVADALFLARKSNMSRIFDHVFLAGLILLGLLCRAPARGELFELRGGGRVVGRLLNPDESPRKTYQIETLSGGRLSLASDQVVQRSKLSPREAEYEKLRTAAPDTIDGHWKMAEWCRENFLSANRKNHLNRIVQLDPNHESARAALGYTRVEGQWKTHREVMESRGFQWYKGRWRTKQSIEVMRRKENRNKGRQKWYGLIKRYHSWLDSDRYEQGRQAILAINDPAAVEALNHNLVKAKHREFKTLYIDVLARINTPDAEKALCACAVEDNDPVVRERCLDHLKKGKWPNAVTIFIGDLKSKDNVIINRAAVALSFMGDKSAIGPLIGALVTKHKYRIGPQNPNNMGVGFGSGSSGLSVGAQPKWARVTKENQAVLDALVSLTGGVNLGFDVRAWKHWYAQQNKRPSIDARRD